MSQQRTSPKGASAKTDLILVGLFLALWIVPYSVLYLAAKLAGGDPTYGPTQFISIADQVRTYQADGDSIVWWHLVGADGDIHTTLFWAIIVLIVGGAGYLAYAFYSDGGQEGTLLSRLPDFASQRFLPKSLERNSRWANARDLRALRTMAPKQGCITVGKRGGSMIATERETSLLVIGPTRSGKTSGLVIPNLFEWDGPAIVTSTKSELVDITGAYRQGVGPVYVYDPTGEIDDQYQTVTWSPIHGCQDLDYAWQVAAWLCAGLQSGGGKSDNDWQHWAESGKLLIAPLLYVAASTGHHSIVDVTSWIINIDISTPMALLQEMIAENQDLTDNDPQRALDMLTGIDQRPDKERGTVFSTVTRIFSLFSGEKKVARSALTSRFNPDDFLRRKGTLYLCTPQQTPERVASLFVGILMTVVTRAYIMSRDMPRGRLVPELGCFLDELANVVPIEELPSMASQGAGRGVILMSIVQDLSQLRQRYGADKSNSILNNHGAKVVLPGISDPETCDQIAKMIGKAEYTDVSVSKNDGKSNETLSVRADQMASPDALRQLKEGTAILVYRGKPPTIVSLRPWYVDRTFLSLSKRRFFKNADYVAYRKSA